jgi:hypothetical protein
METQTVMATVKAMAMATAMETETETVMGMDMAMETVMGTEHESVRWPLLPALFPSMAGMGPEAVRDATSPRPFAQELKVIRRSYFITS